MLYLTTPSAHFVFKDRNVRMIEMFNATLVKKERKETNEMFSNFYYVNCCEILLNLLIFTEL